MSGNDIVKYMTQEIVKYIDLPKDEKLKRKDLKKQKKVNRAARYFGVLPTAIKMHWENKKKGS